jgi:hypothetical protein
MTQLAATVAAVVALAPAAKAQGLFSLFGGGPSSYEIERRLEAGGYQLTHPLIRRGDVYIADVVIGRDDAERLVIDAETGRIVQRFRSGWTRWRDAAPRPWDAEQSDAWNAPPRPPADVDLGGPGETLDLPVVRQGPRAPTGDQFARGEGATAPAVILGRGGARATPLDLIERPKPKPSEAKRKTTTPAPAAAAATPASTPVAATTPPSAAVAPTPPASAPLAVTSPPASPIAATPPSPPANASPPQIGKDDASPSAVAAAKSPAPEAPAPPAPTKSKAVNDLPVAPLD